MKKLFTFLTALVASIGIASAQDTYAITGDYNSWNPTENCITFTEEDGGYKATAEEFKTGTWGFKIIKNGSWDYTYGISNPIATGTDNTLVLGGGNIYLGSENNDVTLHNVTFVFYPGSDGSLDYFRITADENIAIDTTPKVDSYMMVGTWQGWSFENDPLVFEYQGDGVYTASIDEISNDWKIVKNKSWSNALGNGGTEMKPGNTYNLSVVNDGGNCSFASGLVLKDAKFTLTILEDGSATIKIEGNANEEHYYGLVGAFQNWNTGSAAFLTEQADGSWTTDITAFPGGQAFKVSIDKSWTCFLAQDAPTALEFGETYTCARGDNNNNFTIGTEGENYDVHVKLVVADDAQSAELTITDTTNGITLLNTKVSKNEIYNLSGQKMSETKKGINIINGKKVLVNE